jgi:hypothetical protein
MADQERLPDYRSWSWVRSPALLSSDDFGSSVERRGGSHPVHAGREDAYGARCSVCWGGACSGLQRQMRQVRRGDLELRTVIQSEAPAGRSINESHLGHPARPILHALPPRAVHIPPRRPRPLARDLLATACRTAHPGPSRSLCQRLASSGPAAILWVLCPAAASARSASAPDWVQESLLPGGGRRDGRALGVR